MTPESQRIAIAEACGWMVHHAGKYVAHPGGTLCDPLTDLNVMHKAEKVLTSLQRDDYWTRLVRIVDPMDESDDNSRWQCAHATAAQRAEAFLRTLGLWEDDASNLSTVDSRRDSINQEK